MSGKDIQVLEEDKVSDIGMGMALTESDLASFDKKRKLLVKFVSAQLTTTSGKPRPGDDYGTIPGTNQPTLYKPGAEKLARLFNLTVKKECTFQEIDKHQNFAMFTYRCDVFHGGKLIAQCEGSVNSQEKKYKERNIYKAGVKIGSEETPIFDVLNTIQKMAQKRAFVGAIIEACNASDFFTQDFDDPAEAQAAGVDTRQTTRVKTSVPKTKVVSSSDETGERLCECGHPLMVSKFNPQELHCVKCKVNVPR